MARHTAIVVAALLGLSACSDPADNNDCSTPGVQRCNNNALQICMSNYLGGSPYWSSGPPCPSPQVCRVNTAPDGDIAGETGCFDPNAFCPAEGFTSCTTTWSAASPLWSCALRASDQTLQWSKTNCGEQVPKGICMGGYLPGDPPAACLEVVENCPAFPVPDIHCEGTVLFHCFGPTLTDKKAVFDWMTQDCALTGQVCRLEPLSAVPSCAAP